MKTKPKKTNKKQKPVAAGQAAVLKKLDRIREILEPKPKPSGAFKSASDLMTAQTSELDPPEQVEIDDTPIE